MIVSMIAAMGNNRVIGKGNKMMWRLPAEWEYFKTTTLGHCIITGRKNFEAQGRALPGRTNIIVTRNTELKIDGCVVVHSIEAALEYAHTHGETEAFICGGGQIYKESISMVDKIYLTNVDFTDDGEVFFPEFDESLYTKEFKQEMAVSESNKYAWTANLFTKI